MSDSWQVYMDERDGLPAVVFVDLGALSREHEGFTHLVTLRLRALALRDNGLPTAEDFEAVYALEEHLADGALGDDAHYVGRISNRDGYTLYTYASRPQRVEREIRRLATQHARRDPQVELREDPEWQVYIESLVPPESVMLDIRNAAVLDQLRASGDDLRTPRPIDHWLYFDTSEVRDQAGKELAAGGFEIAARRSPDADCEMWGLQVSRVDSVQPDDIGRLTAWFCDFVGQHDGLYDGWETGIVN